jgi:RimJ/RimL family protein N-acetyltransferase
VEQNIMIEIQGIKTNLIEVTEMDADEIIALRAQPQINRYLSSSKPITLQQQVEWIIENQKKGNSLYFKITDKHNHFKGTISLYHINKVSAEFGRFISISSLHALEAQYLLLKYAFDEKKIDCVHCKTIEENRKVWNMHSRYGFQTISVEEHQEPGKKLVVQELLAKDFHTFDYNPIFSLIEKF